MQNQVGNNDDGYTDTRCHRRILDHINGNKQQRQEADRVTHQTNIPGI